MENAGFISLERKFLAWEWWEDHNVTRLFLYLLLNANYTDKKWRGQLVKRGQLIATVATMCAGTGLKTKPVRTALKKLESSGTITVLGQTKYSIITITKYDFYQNGGKQRANKGQTKGKDIIKKQGNKETISDAVDNLQSYPQAAASPRVSLKFDVFSLLSDKGESEAKQNCLGWDFMKLVQEYNHLVRTGKFEMPKYPNKAFPAWVKSRTKGKPPA